MNFSSARISDQLDTPIIDHELQKILLPKVLEMFQYIKEPNGHTTNRNNIERVNLNLQNHTPYSTLNSTPTALSNEQDSSIFSLDSVISYIHQKALPVLSTLWQSSFQSQAQKEETLNFLSQIIFFLFTYGRERPTPAMTLLGLRLIPLHSRSSSILTNPKRKVGKQRLGWLLFFSILLPKLYNSLVLYYLSDNHEDQQNEQEEPTSETSSRTHLDHTNLNMPLIQRRAHVRRIILLRKLHHIISKAIPLLRLANYVSFLYSTSQYQLQSSIPSKNPFKRSMLPPPSPPPPTLAMRLAGVGYADAQTQFLIPIYPSKSSNSSTPLPPPVIPLFNQSNIKPINYVYAHRRLLYLELVRSFWAVLPFSPSQISQWNERVTISSIKQEYVVCIYFVFNLRIEWRFIFFFGLLLFF